jgi:hypothetical protein
MMCLSIVLIQEKEMQIVVRRAYESAPITIDLCDNGESVEVYRHKDKAYVRYYLNRLKIVTQAPVMMFEVDV